MKKVIVVLFFFGSVLTAQSTGISVPVRQTYTETHHKLTCPKGSSMYYLVPNSIVIAGGGEYYADGASNLARVATNDDNDTDWQKAYKFRVCVTPAFLNQLELAAASDD